MNVGALLLILVIGIASVFGVIMAASATNVAPTDTYGNTVGLNVNNSSSAAIPVISTGSRVGAGVMLLVAGVIGISALVVLAWAISSGRKSGRGM